MWKAVLLPTFTHSGSCTPSSWIGSSAGGEYFPVIPDHSLCFVRENEIVPI